MTSKEIADLAGKRHDNTMEVCRDVLAKNVTPEIQESTFNHNGNTYPLIDSSVQQVRTMTSREVVAVINALRPEGKAELRHDDFCRKLLKLKEELSLRNISESDYKSERGKVYTEYLLDKETCLLMVASETPKVLHAIIKRWQELEDQRVAWMAAYPHVQFPAVRALKA